MGTKKKRPTDLNQLAASIVSDAIDDEGTNQPDDAIQGDGKDPHAVALGRKGGLKGGKARAAKLTAEQRKLIAQKAANTRWSKK